MAPSTKKDDSGSGILIFFLLLLVIGGVSALLIFYCKARPSFLSFLNKIKDCSSNDNPDDKKPDDKKPDDNPPAPVPAPTPAPKCVPKSCTAYCGDDGCGGKCSCLQGQSCTNNSCVDTQIPLCDANLGNSQTFSDVCFKCKNCVIIDAVADPNGSIYPIAGTVTCESCGSNQALNTNVGKIDIAQFGKNKFAVSYDGSLSHTLKAYPKPYNQVKCVSDADCVRFGMTKCSSGNCI